MFFGFVLFACFWNLWLSSEKDTKERTNTRRSQSTGPHQHLWDAGLTSRRWWREEPFIWSTQADSSSVWHWPASLLCCSQHPILCLFDFNKQQEAKPHSQGRRRVCRSAAQHLDSNWGSVWVKGESRWKYMAASSRDVLVWVGGGSLQVICHYVSCVYVGLPCALF